jgi:quercetin dioxygenase-like cupin family protein
LNIGETIPLHHATSDAFLIGRKGIGKITFADREVILSGGKTLLIKANEPHKMDVIEDFSSYLVLDLNGVIKINNIQVVA